MTADLASTAPASILVVEDDEDLCVVLQAVLESEGYEVLVASDGPTALAASRGRPLFAAVLDLHLPGQHGVDLAEELRALDPGVRVVLMTGEDRAAVPEGVALLSKPFGAGRLLQALRALD